MPDANFSSDKPNYDPALDELNRASFAAHLAKSILKMSPVDGYVIAIYGTWGSGKSTLLGYVNQSLEQAESHEKPIVLQFNPWWFSGRNEMVQHFFNELNIRFNQDGNQFKEFRQQLSEFADAVSNIPIPIFSEATKAAGKLIATKEVSVIEQKKELSNALRNFNRRIVIIIDDIDRLPTDEVGELFRIIKAIVDLPNIVYILAFDKQRTSDAITASLNLPGEDYLEKIVQLPIDLPLPEPYLLMRILERKILEVVEDFPTEVFSPRYSLNYPQLYGYNAFNRALTYFIKTPRHITRLINVLRATFPVVKDEVNPVDFVSVELLRLFSMQLYEIARNNPQIFAGSTRSMIANDENNTAFLKELLTDLTKENKTGEKDILAYLFPKVLSLVEQSRSDDDNQLRRDLRVASPEIFPVYFQLSVPSTSISSAEIRAHLSVLTTDNAANAFTETLQTLFAQHQDRFYLFLDRLKDYKAVEPIRSHISAVVKAILNIGDTLISHGESELGRLTIDLLSEIDQQERYDLLVDTIKTGKSLTGVIGIVADLGARLGRFGELAAPSRMQYVNQTQLQVLEKFALERIQKAIHENILIEASNLSMIIMCWRNWSDAGDAQPIEWLNNVIATDEGLLNLLRQSMQPQKGSTRPIRFPYERYQSLLELDSIKTRLQTLLDTSQLTEPDKFIISEFLNPINQW